ncbi:MAG TPA: type II toxin-antitoxin system VapB family antitoxin [Acetobacteraceae bacterium]|nr:type II toxin-antitoxin system VapB family antitoxin [Acetobacteraceae bacterium]
MDTAKVFWTGRSQAVRLPKEYRFDTDEVRIRRHGAAIILEPIPKDWAWLDAIVGPLDEDFVKAALDRPSGDDRPPIKFPE